MQPVDLKSTSLQSAAYQAQLGVLELKFIGGASYQYFCVPASVYEDLLRAGSKGAYFNHHIRNRFVFAKLPVTGPNPNSRLQTPLP